MEKNINLKNNNKFIQIMLFLFKKKSKSKFIYKFKYKNKYMCGNKFPLFGVKSGKKFSITKALHRFWISQLHNLLCYFFLTKTTINKKIVKNFNVCIYADCNLHCFVIHVILLAGTELNTVNNELRYKVI
jgi:hypothetical protein